MKKVGIVGFGYVGKAMYHVFKDHYDVKVYDSKFMLCNDHKNTKNVDVITRQWFEQKDNITPIIKDDSEIKISSKLVTKEGLNECDVAVVCVPTPMGDDGACDVSIVEDVVKWLETPLILIKSTVSPGSTDRFVDTYKKNIVFSPEYCGESSYWTPYKFHTDVKETPFFVFGGAKEHTTQCVNLFMPVTGPTKQYRQCTALVAETAKYMENTFYATKVTLCHEFKLMCDAMGVDYNDAREVWLMDPRLHPMHTAVFDKKGPPFGGKCLPKDINAFIKASQKNGYQPELLKAVLKSNERIGELR